MLRKCVVLGLGLGLIAVITPFLFAELSFKSYRNFSSSGDGSVAAMSADFNNDQIPDLAIANTFTGDVSIMLGDGLGGFLAPRRFPAGPGAFFVAAADFNNDNNLDLAVANFAEPSISVLLGDGTGQFSSPRNFPVADKNTGLVVADFNRDGILDIAVACFGVLPETPDCSRPDFMSFTVSVLIGRPAAPGEVQFDSPINLRSGCSPEGVYAADFNNDGYPDLIATNFFGFDIGVFLNSQGAFPPTATRYNPAIVGPAYGAVADFNHDGKLDFASANFGSYNVSILLGDGQGSFQQPIRNFTTQNGSMGRSPRAIVVGDFNSDDHLDLATSNYESNDVSVLFGRGDGSFSDPFIIPLEGELTWFMTSGDFNNDGHIDLAVVRQDGRTRANISVLSGDGAGDFGNYSSVQSGPNSVAVDDFNGDGNLDLVIANVESNDVLLRLGDGQGGFSYQERLPVGSRPVAVIAADFNNDEAVDLATANFGSNDVTVWLGDGAGHFSMPRQFSVNGALPNYLVAADFNGDGRLDIATANFGSNNVSVLLADESGGFGPAQTFQSGGTNPWFINIGDFNGDGRADLVVVNSGSDDISILLGDGMGGFASAQRYGVGRLQPSWPRSVVVGDYDGDGNEDVAVVSSGSADVTILYGDGQGGFQRQSYVDLGPGSGGVYLSQGDLDGDEMLDLAVADFNRNQVHVLRGNGEGFFEPLSYFAGLGPVSLAIGDYTNDGKADLAVIDAMSQTLSILINDSQP